MSIATHPTETRPQSDGESYDCASADCSFEFPAGDGVRGSYCSHECSLRAEGRRLLNVLKHDHRYCYTCFRRLKDTENAAPKWRRERLGPVTEAAVTAIQFRTEHARTGEVLRRTPAGIPDDTRLGTVCECGNASLQEREAVIRSLDIRGVASNLLEALAVVHQEGQTSERVAPLPLVRALQAQVRAGREWDFPLAVGLALEARHDA